MLSAIAATKVAGEICNNPDLKREILCATGSAYDPNKGNSPYARRRQWSEIIRKQAAAMLRNVGLVEELKLKVVDLIRLMAFRILAWAEYHERTLGLSREYSVHFLKSSFFTQRGIIDNKSAAVEMMKDESLTIEQKYKLACIYCFCDDIPYLHSKMAPEDQEKFYDAQDPRRIHQQDMVMFWSYHLMGRIELLKGRQHIVMYRVLKAVNSGCKAAVKFSLEYFTLWSKKQVMLSIAGHQAVKSRITATKDASILFRDKSSIDSEVSWIPNDYYVDILCFLFSEMNENVRVAFLRRDVDGLYYPEEPHLDRRRSRVLECFLDWPYEDYFMKTVGMMWEFLPERHYTQLLLWICANIDSMSGRVRDYRALLREFWYQSPERFKSYALNDAEVPCKDKETGVINEVKACEELMYLLFTLNNFTDEDGQNIELILADATMQQKENIVASQRWRCMCMTLIKKQKWEVLDRYVLSSFLPREGIGRLKKELSLTEEARKICIDFIKRDKWHAVESFLKWSSLPENEIMELKKTMIYSEYGSHACLDLYLYDGDERRVNKFLRWCFPSEDELKTFKKHLIFSHWGIHEPTQLAVTQQPQKWSSLVKFCLSSEEEIRQLKKVVLHNVDYTLSYIISHKEYGEPVYDDAGNVSEGGIIYKWEKVESFMTWCFSSEEEYDEYKQNISLDYLRYIHFRLISTNQWADVEIFFAWLRLCDEDIKELKKETLTDDDDAWEHFVDVMYSDEGDFRFVDYGTKQEAIELLLRWYLTDKESVHEFEKQFKREFRGDAIEEVGAMLENFDLAIEQRLRDLDEELRTVERKSETPTPKRKKFLNSKFANMGKEYWNIRK